MKNVRVKIVDMGQGFATEAQIIALNGRRLASTGACPYGFDDVAETAGRELAKKRGWHVVGVIPAKRD